jgi:hypothetical protein
MSQVTIYLDEESLFRAKAAAAASKQSLSAWMAQLVKEQAPAVDANGYPLGFFDRIESASGAWSDFPTLENIRDTEIVDLAREQISNPSASLTS